MFKHLTTKGLECTAEACFRNEARNSFENVNTCNKLIQFLFVNFNGSYFADKISNGLQQLSQNSGEHILNYNRE